MEVETKNKVRPGYKQTEVGMIPGDWQIRPLLSAVRVANGQVDPKVEPYRSMILVAPDHIESGTGHLLKKRTAGDQHAISGKYLFGKGDIVYSKIRPYLRKAILADFEGLCSADMYPLRPAADVSAGFVLAAILGHHFSKYAESVSVRSGMPKMNRAEMAEYSMALPSNKHEQDAIAGALTDADALIDGLTELIAKKRDLKQATMQQLLTGNCRLPGFSGEWEIKELGGVSSIKTGKKDVNEGNPGGAYPFFTCSREMTFSDRYSFDGEAILIAGNGEVGNLHRYAGKFEAYQRTYVLQEFTLDVDYLWHQLIFGFKRSLGIGTIGSSIPYIKRENIADFSFPAPVNEAERSAIATVICDMDAELALLEQRREKAHDLKQGMMQELLTGKTRLI